VSGPSPDGGHPVEDGFDDLLGRLDPAASPADNIDAIVAELARVLGLAGAGVSALSDDVSRGALACSSPVAEELEAEQFTCGEGPCLEAFERRQVVLEPDLAGAGRWPMFTPAALRLGVPAVFAFPLAIGGQVIGALDLYGAEARSLTVREQEACVLIAEVLAQLAAAVAGDLPSGALPRSLDDVAQDRAEVHQAAGITAVQLDVHVGEAMALMRAQAWSDETPLRDLAHAIVSHRIRLAP
jgi:transcriptional regulator with GAF, ATPase, and Fis domain